jgi:DNA gyrase subunit B
MATMDRLDRQYDSHILHQMVLSGLPQEPDMSDQDKLTEYFNELLISLSSDRTGGVRYTVRIDKDETGNLRVRILRWIHGSETEIVLDDDFFQSSEFKMMRELSDRLNGLLDQTAVVQRGERRQPVESFTQVMDWLMSEARRGLSIQRYKGLGEMNPDQLWETTMNPETRRLLQVRVEDAVAADEVFTTLMGDQVEPRREFIEDNALSASNIDI